MKRDLTLVGSFLFFVLLAAAAVLSQGCGTPYTVARKTITAIDIANASAPRLARPAIRACIDAAVKIGKASGVNAGEQALQDCTDQRDKVMRAVKLSTETTDAAAAGVDLAEAAQTKDLSKIMAPAYSAARALCVLLADMGVKVPSIPGVCP